MRNIFGIDIESKLKGIKKKEIASNDKLNNEYKTLVDGVLVDDNFRKQVLANAGFKQDSYLKQIKPDTNKYSEASYIKLCEIFGIENVFHRSDIKELAFSYRLRMLGSSRYIGNMPKDLHIDIDKVNKLCEENDMNHTDFRVLAPAKLFALDEVKIQPKPIDPILFLRVNDYFIKVKKWGNDLNPLRWLIAIPTRSKKSSMIFKYVTTALMGIGFASLTSYLNLGTSNIVLSFILGVASSFPFIFNLFSRYSTSEENWDSVYEY